MLSLLLLDEGSAITVVVLLLKFVLAGRWPGLLGLVVAAPWNRALRMVGLMLAVVMACCAFYLHGEYQWEVYRNHRAWNVSRLYQLYPPYVRPCSWARVRPCFSVAAARSPLASCAGHEWAGLAAIVAQAPPFIKALVFVNGCAFLRTLWVHALPTVEQVALPTRSYLNETVWASFCISAMVAGMCS